VAALGVLVYARTISFDLAYDDREIGLSPLVHDPWNVFAVFAGRFYSGSLEHVHLYRPLSQWSLLLTWRANEVLFGRGDHGLLLHAENVGLHAGACVVLLSWLGSLGLSRFVALVAAMLFAVHPIHAEAVGNVSARSDPMAFLLGVAFLLLDRRGRPGWAALALACALWSKESAVTFLPLLLVAGLLFPVEGSRYPVRRGLLYTGVVGAWLVLRHHAVSGQEALIQFLDNPVGRSGALERVLTAAGAQLDYLGTLCWPVGIATEHGYAETVVLGDPLSPAVLFFTAILVAAGVSAWILRRRAPVVALGVLGYAITFSITSNFLFPIGTIRAERLAYAPSAFFCLLVAAGLGILASRFRRSTTRVAVPTLLASLGGLAAVQVGTWRDAETLFRDQVRSSPASAKAHLNLARTLDERGDFAGAIREYERSGAIYANYKWTWLLLGNARQRAGDGPGAIEAWRFALRVDGNFLDARARILEGFLDRGRRGDALVEWRALLDANRFHPRTIDLAVRLWNGSVALERDHAEAELLLAREELRQGAPAAALERLRRIAGSGACPENVFREVLGRIGDCHELLGRPGRAEAFRQASALPVS
jgi:hypothetical protein